MNEINKKAKFQKSCRQTAWQQIKGEVHPKMKSYSSSTQPHTDGKSGDVSRPQNISGASQQNSVVLILKYRTCEHVLCYNLSLGIIA